MVIQRSRILQYGANGRSAIRQSYTIEQYFGPLWRTKKQIILDGKYVCDIVLLYGDFTYGLMFYQGEDINSNPMKFQNWIEYNNCFKPEGLAELMTKRMNRKRFIGKPETMFVRQFDVAVANQMKEYHLEYFDKCPNQGELWISELQQEMIDIEANIEGEKAKKLAKEFEKLQGWGENETASRKMKMLSCLNVKVMSGRGISQCTFILRKWCWMAGNP